MLTWLARKRKTLLPMLFIGALTALAMYIYVPSSVDFEVVRDETPLGMLAVQPIAPPEPPEIASCTSSDDDQGAAVDTVCEEDRVMSSIAAISYMPVHILRDARREGKRRESTLIGDWAYCYPPDGRVVIVPKGYTTDFASIPPYGRLVADPFGDHAEASVVHDWLYSVGEGRDGAEEQLQQKRLDADQIFYYAMREQKVAKWQRDTIYRSVRLGGSAPYKRESEWTDRWLPSGSEAEVEVPPKPKSGFVGRVNECAYIEQETQIVDLLKFQIGNEVDECTSFKRRVETSNGPEGAFYNYVSCLEEELLEPLIMTIPNSASCTNKSNFACSNIEMLQDHIKTRWIESGADDSVRIAEAQRAAYASKGLLGLTELMTELGATLEEERQPIIVE